MQPNLRMRNYALESGITPCWEGTRTETSWLRKRRDVTSPEKRSELFNMWVGLRLTQMLIAVTFLCFRMMELPKGQH